MSKLRFFFILMLLLGIAASSFAQEEIQIGDSVDGEEDDDLVEYELFLEEDQTVQISVSSDDFDTYLYLLDEDGDEITRNDDYDGTNSFIVYTAEDSETVTIQVGSCCSGEGPRGDYELSVEEVVVQEEIDGGQIEYGDSVEIEPSGTTLITFTFEGSEGDVITITAVSQGSDDTRLVLSDPDGDEIMSNDDDGGLNRNPAIRRFELPATGEYTIEVESFADTALFSNIDISLELTDLLLVNDGPQTVELTPEHIADTMTFDVEEDAAYLVTVTLSESSDSSLFLYVQEEEQSFAVTRLSFSATPTIAFVFVAQDTGRAQIRLEFYTYEDEVEVTIQAEPLPQ